MKLPNVALSIRQPWAWLILHGGKNIENRTWSTTFRGPFLIHAAKGMTRDEYEDAVDFASDVDPTTTVPAANDLDRGGIVGVAFVIDIVRPYRGLPASIFDEMPSLALPWHMDDRHGFVLAAPAPLPFVPCRGMLGFFRVDDAVSAELARLTGGAR